MGSLTKTPSNPYPFEVYSATNSEHAVVCITSQTLRGTNVLENEMTLSSSHLNAAFTVLGEHTFLINVHGVIPWRHMYFRPAKIWVQGTLNASHFTLSFL